MKKIIGFIFLLIAFIFTDCQSITYFNTVTPWLGAIKPSANNDFLTFWGNTYGELDSSGFVIKLKQVHDTLPTRQIGILDYIVNSDSSIMLAGTVADINYHQSILVVKINKADSVLYTKTLTDLTYNDVILKILPTRDRNWMLMGVRNDLNYLAEETKGVIIKIDSNGNTIWTKKYANLLYGVEIEDAVELPNGDIFIVVNSYGQLDVLKINANGQMLTYNHYGPLCSSGCDPAKIICVQDTNVFCFINSLLACYDFNGHMRWYKSYGGLSDLSLTGIVHNNGNFFVAGTRAVGSHSTINTTNIFLSRLDSVGNLIWAKNYGRCVNEASNGIVANANNELLLWGTSDIYDEFQNYYCLFKTDTSGLSACNGNLDTLETVTVQQVWRWADSVSTTTWLSLQDYAPITFSDVTSQITDLCSLHDTCYYFQDDISEVYVDKSVSVFPNPIHNEYQLQLFGSPDKELIFRIFNPVGRLVRTSKIMSVSSVFRRDDLNDGVYFWELESPGATIQRGKLVFE